MRQTPSPPTAELACIVLAVGSPPELPGAVRSLLAQGEPLEIVVVSSGGGGDAEADLRAAGLPVRVVRHGELLLPGAARNAGIVATGAPWLSFLAADCRAEPGWVAGRLRAHREGHAAVASAITNPFPRNPAAWVSQVALFARRAPGVPASEALRYGASYGRGLFERFGTFREDLRGGEDTELHSRFAGQLEVAWAPEVRTAHLHPRSPAALLRDQLARGARTTRALAALGGPGPQRVAAYALLRMLPTFHLAWRYAAAGERPWLAAAAPLLPAAAAAYALGALREGRTGRSAGREAAARRDGTRSPGRTAAEQRR
jgi:hypothetical protein